MLGSIAVQERFNNDKAKYLKLVNPLLKIISHERTSTEALIFSDVSSIAIVDVTLIGDAVINIPFYKVVRKSFPNASITIIGKPWIKEQLHQMRLYDKYYCFDVQRFFNSPISVVKNWGIIKRALQDINSTVYDLAFEPIGDERYIYFMHLLSAKRKVSYNYTDDAFLLTDAIEPDWSIKSSIDVKLHLLEAIGCEISDNDRIPELPSTDSQLMDNANYFLQGGISEDMTVIGVHPGASLEAKQYPRYPKLITSLCDILDPEHYAFIIFCGPGERQITELVCQAAASKGFNAFVSEEELGLYIKRIASCDCMICNDSGAAHLAAAYGVPVTVIFGPIDPAKFAPRGTSGVYIVSLEKDCKPCNRPICPLGTNDCINDISVQDCVSAVRRMIAEIVTEDE